MFLNVNLSFYQRLLQAGSTSEDVVGLVETVGEALQDWPTGRGDPAGSRLPLAPRLFLAAGQEADPAVHSRPPHHERPWFLRK